MNEEKLAVFGFCVKDDGDRVISETGYKSESSIPSRRLFRTGRSHVV